MKKDTGVTQGYLHGFTQDEQNRLYEQARFLAPSVFEPVNFSRHTNVLEVGCGVGAQTEILLTRFPNLRVTGFDASPVQIERAQQHFASLPKTISERVTFEVADALHLPYPDDVFDGGFICWFLEHVQDPIGILNEVRRVLRAGADVHVNEVLNATPYSPATQQYWLAFNDHQWNLGGDPFVGAKLANYLMRAGFQNITTDLGIHHYDNRTPKRRAAFIAFWTRLLLSGAPQLITAGRVTQETVRTMTEELERLKNDPDAAFFYTFVRAHAQAF
jgi:ubiquinone/menaquinone biosynthesis C-methylase UbiE